jgi:hypothetical protein
MTLRASTLPMVGRTFSKFVTPDVSASKTAVQNWSALTAAADRCALLDASDGGKHIIWVPPGSYNMDASAGYTGLMRLMAIPGTVKFVVAVTKPAIKINQVTTAGGPYLITAIDDAVHPDVTGTDSNAVTHRLTCTTAGEAANFQRGDAIFVGGTNTRSYYTNNVIVYTGGTVNYIAESATVESINTGSGYVYLAAPLYLWSLFSTGMYCYRLSRAGGPEIDGIDFDTADDPITQLGTANAGVPMIDLVACNRGYIRNCTIHRSYHAAISMTSCSRVRVENNTVLYAPSNGSTSYGYGVTVQAASYGCVVDSNYFEACRHAYTGDGLSTTSAFSQGSWYTYGDQRACIVSNNKAVGCTGAAFDTHEPSIDTAFIGNVAVDSHRPSHGTAGNQATLVSGSSNPAGYQIRGRADIIEGGAVLGATQGIVIMSPGIQHEKISGEGGSAETKTGLISVTGLTFDSYMNNNTGFYAIDIWGNASITLTDQVAVDIQDFNIKHFPRGINIRGGVGRAQFVGGIVRSYDVELTLAAAANGDYAFLGTVFDGKMRRSGEDQIAAAATTAGTLTLINTVHRPIATSNLINATSGCTLTVRHCNVVNANSAVTLTMVGGTGSGTVTKTALTALT